MRRTPRSTACLVVAAMTVALTSTLVGALPAVAQGPDPQLRLLQERDSLLARHVTYRQLYRGVPVLGGYYVEHRQHDGSVRVDDGRLAVAADVSTRAGIERTVAERTALARVGGELARSELAILPGATPRLVWSVDNADSRRVLVDAGTGAIVRVESLVKYATGRGLVFEPNPVVALQNENLTDQGDAVSAVPAAAYRRAQLLHLDGSGYLHGRYATIALSIDAQAYSPTNTFNYNRQNDYFEQVESYYAVDSAQVYFQSLGFTDVNNEPQDLKPDAISADNSFYSPSSDSITFGTGGVDDAEDPEVIWHELGHAVQDDQVPGFGSTTQAGSIGEGFGDYLALTMSQRTAPNTVTTPWACIMDWDATAYTQDVPHCLRRADTDKHWPEDRTNEVHADGEIWSAALYDINRAIGRERTDTAILEGQFSFTPGTTFAAAAADIVAAAQDLYGSGVASVVQRVFHARGFI